MEKILPLGQCRSGQLYDVGKSEEIKLKSKALKF